MPRQSNAQHRWVRLASIAVACLIAFALITWIDLTSPGIADLRITQIQFAKLKSPNIEELAQADFQPLREPFRLGAFAAVARIEFDRDKQPNEPLALFIRRGRDNYAVYVNGQLAANTPGQLSPIPTLHGIVPRLVPILPALLKPGVNRIDVIFARQSLRVTFREMYFGSLARLEPPFEHSWTLARGVPAFAAVTAGLTLLFALAIAALIRKPALILAIALTLVFLLLREFHTLALGLQWNGDVRDAFGLCASVGSWVAVAAFVNEWTGGPPRLRLLMVGVVGIGWSFIITAFAILGSFQAYPIAGYAEASIVVTTLSFVAYRLVRHYASAPPAAAGEIVAFVVAFIMAVSTFITQIGISYDFAMMLPTNSDAFSRLASQAVIIAIAIALARHSVGLYRLAQMNNETLALRVREKENELETNYATLREQEREHAALAERGRIMRDVHDGIGSHLLGLLLQARAGKLEGQALTTGLQSALEDLHLVVDSLDQSEGPLETALGAFRNRIMPRCDAAGIEVGWNIEELGETPAIGPAAVLQIYRILQEACSNAIKHANPKHLEFTLRRRAAEANRIEIVLKNDGRGFDSKAESKGGRGLSNMRRRALAIGAKFDIESDAQGSCVRLLLPAG